MPDGTSLKHHLLPRLAAGVRIIERRPAVHDHNVPWGLAPHGWGIRPILLQLIALFVLVDGVVSFEKSRPSDGPQTLSEGADQTILGF